MSLSNKVVIVASDFRELALKIVQYLYKEHAKIYLLGPNPSRLNSIIEAIDSDLRSNIHALVCDLKSPTSITEAFSRLDADEVDADILINEVHYDTHQALSNQSFEEWRKNMDNNVGTTFVLMQQAYLSFKNKGCGQIINIAELAKNQGHDSSSFLAAKAAIQGLSLAAAHEWQEENILVDAIVPAAIKSVDRIEKCNLIPYTYSLEADEDHTIDIIRSINYLINEQKTALIIS